MRHQGPRKVDDGKAQHSGDGKQSCTREGGEKREKRPAKFLTPKQNSGGGSQQQKSGEAATAMANEMRGRRRHWVGLRGKRRRLRVLRILGHVAAAL
jgi:hypothetical protein